MSIHIQILRFLIGFNWFAAGMQASSAINYFEAQNIDKFAFAVGLGLVNGGVAYAVSRIAQTLQRKEAA